MGCQLGTFLFKKEKMKRKCSQWSQEIVQPSGTNIVWFQGLEINPCLFPQVMSHGAQLYVLGFQNYPSSFLLFFPFSFLFLYENCIHFHLNSFINLFLACSILGIPQHPFMFGLLLSVQYGCVYDTTVFSKIL